MDEIIRFITDAGTQSSLLDTGELVDILDQSSIDYITGLITRQESHSEPAIT